MRAVLLVLLFLVPTISIFGQDPTPTQKIDSIVWPTVDIDSMKLNTMEIDTMAIDTTVVDTLVIRRLQERVDQLQKEVILKTSIISLKKTKPLSKEYSKFKVPSFWQKINLLGVNFNEVAFVNWKSGGNNSISALGNARFERNYKFRYIQWGNTLEFRYGISAQDNQKLRKTDDAIRVSSTFGFRRDTISNWYYSAKANFNTQFSNGFKYPDRATPVSGPLAPGYFFLGAGTSYITENRKFNLYISPITQKATIVMDQDLANKGAFGVQKAVVDSDGNIIKEGENSFLELGFLITNNWETQITKNIGLKHRLNLYTDYLKKFGNIDIDWEVNMELRVNKYIVTTIGTHVIYDDDIRFDPVLDANKNVINPGDARIQFKQLLGVGVSYNF